MLTGYPHCGYMSYGCSVGETTKEIPKSKVLKTREQVSDRSFSDEIKAMKNRNSDSL